MIQAGLFSRKHHSGVNCQAVLRLEGVNKRELGSATIPQLSDNPKIMESPRKRLFASNPVVFEQVNLFYGSTSRMIEVGTK